MRITATVKEINIYRDKTIKKIHRRSCLKSSISSLFFLSFFGWNAINSICGIRATGMKTSDFKDRP